MLEGDINKIEKVAKGGADSLARIANILEESKSKKKKHEWSKNLSVILSIVSLLFSYIAIKTTWDIESHNKYMEKFNYYLSSEESDFYYYIEEKLSTIKQPEVVINIKSGSIQKINYIVFKDDEIKVVEQIESVDIEKEKISYDDFVENYKVGSRFEKTEYYIEYNNIIYIPYYILIEGMNGDKHLELIIEEVDRNQKLASLFFYDELDVLNTSSKDSLVLKFFNDYEKLRDMLKTKDIL